MVRRVLALITLGFLLHLSAVSSGVLAQSAASNQQAVQSFDVPQLDTPLAPVALYSDELSWTRVDASG